MNEGLVNYWAYVQFQQAGGIEPFAAMLSAANTQCAMKILGCMSPDSHGAIMDAPLMLEAGVRR